MQACLRIGALHDMLAGIQQPQQRTLQCTGIPAIREMGLQVLRQHPAESMESYGDRERQVRMFGILRANRLLLLPEGSIVAAVGEAVQPRLQPAFQAI